MVMGHCGFSLAPASHSDAHFVMKNLERAEDISGAAMEAGIDWTWTTFAEYLDAVNSLPKGINYASNVGHSALRTYAMGERAFTEEASPSDLAAMEAELRDALRAGAYGFSTSRTHHHETADRLPVASRMASWDEVRGLVLAMGEMGAGVFQLVEDPPSPSERVGPNRSACRSRRGLQGPHCNPRRRLESGAARVTRSSGGCRWSDVRAQPLSWCRQHVSFGPSSLSMGCPSGAKSERSP